MTTGFCGVKSSAPARVAIFTAEHDQNSVWVKHWQHEVLSLSACLFSLRLHCGTAGFKWLWHEVFFVSGESERLRVPKGFKEPVLLVSATFRVQTIWICTKIMHNQQILLPDRQCFFSKFPSLSMHHCWEWWCFPSALRCWVLPWGPLQLLWVKLRGSAEEKVWLFTPTQNWPLIRCGSGVDQNVTKNILLTVESKRQETFRFKSFSAQQISWENCHLRSFSLSLKRLLFEEKNLPCKWIAFTETAAHPQGFRYLKGLGGGCSRPHFYSPQVWLWQLSILFAFSVKLESLASARTCWPNCGSSSLCSNTKSAGGFLPQRLSFVVILPKTGTGSRYSFNPSLSFNMRGHWNVSMPPRYALCFLDPLSPQPLAPRPVIWYSAQQSRHLRVVRYNTA